VLKKYEVSPLGPIIIDLGGRDIGARLQLPQNCARAEVEGDGASNVHNSKELAKHYPETAGDR
jgi:hypothetical protein